MSLKLPEPFVELPIAAVVDPSVRELAERMQRNLETIGRHGVDERSGPEQPRVVGAAGEPAFAGTWANYGGAGEPTAAFYKDRNRVYLRGLVTGGAAGSTIFTLPAGYRPIGNARFPCEAGGAYAMVYVTAAGAVIFYTGTTPVALEPVNFRVA